VTTTDNSAPQQFYHGTRADLKPGALIEAGYSSNYGKRKQASWVYLTDTLEAAVWGAELAAFPVLPAGMTAEIPARSQRS